VYSRLRLDISVRDLLFGLLACWWAWRRHKLSEDVVRACSPGTDELVVCLSVRSGFNLLLTALELPVGSEVLVSAVTHPDMVHIIERHGLRALPVDLDLETLTPRAELLERAVSSHTRAVLIAHLFGGRMDLGPIADFARSHNLLLVEDSAQAFKGPHAIRSSVADVSMFSFGPIKTATALGGALFRVRDPIIRKKVRELHARWPVQHRYAYLGKLLKYLCLVLMTRPRAYRLIARTSDLLGQDFDALSNRAVRGFPSQVNQKTTHRTNGTESGAAPALRKEFFQRIRHQPSAPLLALLAHRLRTFDEARLARRTLVGERVAYRLSPHLLHPGRLSASRTHWIFPVVPFDPKGLISSLRGQGYDAARATTNIAAINAPPDRPELAPTEAIRMMSSIVFLPVYPELSDKALRRLSDLLDEVAGNG
jgi:perosamine synthetase